MTEHYKTQDVELNDNEDVLEAHDPKNAEMQSVDAVDKAADAGPSAKKRTGDKSNSEPMPKTKAGILNAMYNKMSGMKKDQLKAEYEKMMGEAVEFDESVEFEAEIEYKEDLEALIRNDESLSEDFKKKAATIFEAAVTSKVHEKVAAKEAELSETLSSKIDSLEEQYAQEIEEGLNQTRDELVEKIDSYLNYVVETWMEDNKLAVETGLRTEIAETFMNNLKNLFVESYIEVPESKVDLVDELALQVEELETRLNKETAKNIEMREENEKLLRGVIIREASRDLAETQVSKLEKMAESIEFNSEEDFAEKVNTIKESYFNSSTATTSESVVEISAEDEGEEEIVAPSANMEQYISALRKTQAKD